MAGPSVKSLCRLGLVLLQAISVLGATQDSSHKDILMKRSGPIMKWAERARRAITERAGGSVNPELVARRRKKGYQGIDMSKLRGHHQVRFVLAASQTNSTPTVIEIPGCTGWKGDMGNWATSSFDYQNSKLSTNLLSSDPLVGRSCQAFNMVNEDGGNRAGRRGGGYAIAVVEANTSNSDIGWHMGRNQLPDWVENIDGGSLEGRINVDCESWWQGRKELNAPDYYGRYCRLKLMNSDGPLCIQAAQDQAWTGKPIEASLCSTDPLQYWHLQGVAREYPDFCGNGCSDPLYNTDPNSVIVNDPKRCECQSRWNGFKYGGPNWSDNCTAATA